MNQTIMDTDTKNGTYNFSIFRITFPVAVIFICGIICIIRWTRDERCQYLGQTKITLKQTTRIEMPKNDDQV